MPKAMTQIKFTIDTEIAAAFKARCTDIGVSMTSVICQWMKNAQVEKTAKTKTDTRPLRKKAVAEIIGLLNNIMELESEYRDHIPEQFTQRHETAERACDQLSEAIACLEETF
jgi:hypothetical protein